MLSGSQILAEEVRVFRFDRPRGSRKLDKLPDVGHILHSHFLRNGGADSYGSDHFVRRENLRGSERASSDWQATGNPEHQYNPDPGDRRGAKGKLRSSRRTYGVGARDLFSVAAIPSL